MAVRGPDAPGLADEALTVGARTWQLAGHAVELAGAEGRDAERRGALAIGVIADAAGAAPATLAALGRLRAGLASADLVVALGGMGATQAELEASLGALAEGAPWALVAVPGDLESAPALTRAVGALRARGLAVIDGRLVRRLVLPGATVAVVAGAGADSRLVAGPDGCAYAAADVTAAFADLAPRAGLRILATAEPPRVTVGGEPAGELALTASAGQQVDLILHGPATEAPSPARGGGRDAAAIALSPGTSDATTRLPGPRRPSSAGLLTITGAAWRWRPVTDE